MGHGGWDAHGRGRNWGEIREVSGPGEGEELVWWEELSKATGRRECVWLQSTLFVGERVAGEDKKLDREVLWRSESQRSPESWCLGPITTVAGPGRDRSYVSVIQSWTEKKKSPLSPHSLLFPRLLTLTPFLSPFLTFSFVFSYFSGTHSWTSQSQWPVSTGSVFPLPGPWVPGMGSKPW